MNNEAKNRQSKTKSEAVELQEEQLDKATGGRAADPDDGGQVTKRR